jgi:hypothetical protein
VGSGEAGEGDVAGGAGVRRTRRQGRDTATWQITDCAKRYLRRYMGLRDFEGDQEASFRLRHMVQFARILLKRAERYQERK